MYLFTFTSLFSFAAAAPTLLSRNILAGGPSVTPIPSNCTLQNVKPWSASTAFNTRDTFTTAHKVYTLYLPSYYNTSHSQTMCLEQCYGFGNPEECVSTLWAQNVTYTAYGSTVTGDVCTFYGVDISKKDLKTVTDGQYLNAKATNIKCPSPRNP